MVLGDIIPRAVAATMPASQPLTTAWRFVHGDPIDELAWLREGVIRTMSGDLVRSHEYEAAIR